MLYYNRHNRLVVVLKRFDYEGVSLRLFPQCSNQLVPTVLRKMYNSDITIIQHVSAKGFDILLQYSTCSYYSISASVRTIIHDQTEYSIITCN